MLSKVIVLACLVLAAQASVRVQFRACPGGLPVPNWVESDECGPLGDRCILRRGSIFHARANVTPLQNFNELWVDITATLLGIPFPIEIPPGYENACPFLEAGATCPVRAGNTYVWGIQAPIATTYPAVNNLQVQIRAGENGQWAACAIVASNIV